MAPITPGSAAAAFPASAFSQLARTLSYFLSSPRRQKMVLVLASNNPDHVLDGQHNG